MSLFLTITLTLTLIIALRAFVTMFGVQRGEGAVQFARSGPELVCHEQGGPLAHPHCGTRPTPTYAQK